MLFESPLISPTELYNVLDHENIVILDSTIDKVGQSLKDKPLELIPNSHFFDIEDKLSDKTSTLPHTLVSPKVFEIEMQKLGINQDSTVIVYDRWGIYSSPRAWWMLKVMGLSNVYVLDGGIPEWLKMNYPTISSYASDSKLGDFRVNFQSQWFADKDYIINHYSNDNITIIDARSEGRFNGVVPEPREGLNGGHIPNSKNIPFEKLLNTTKYIDSNTILTEFNTIDSVNKEHIFTCGSGVTASILAFASHLIGTKNIRVYDGSWSEWGKKELQLPFEK